MRTLRTLIMIICFISLPISTSNATEADDHPITILVLGDSLSAAYGIPKELGWVNLLRESLGTGYKVVNASISGETTDGGLQRLPKHLDDYNPDLLIIELGANDGLRGFPLSLFEDKLSKLVTLGLEADAEVLLAGIHIPPNYGRRYTEAFYDVFLRVKDQYKVSFVPFLLEGVATAPELMQDDRLHPTADAQPILLSNIKPYITELLTRLD